jgi:hypothetical protein
MDNSLDSSSDSDGSLEPLESGSGGRASMVGVEPPRDNEPVAGAGGGGGGVSSSQPRRFLQRGSVFGPNATARDRIARNGVSPAAMIQKRLPDRVAYANKYVKESVGGEVAVADGGGGGPAEGGGEGPAHRRREVLPKPTSDDINSQVFIDYINQQLESNHLESNEPTNARMTFISKYSDIQKLLKSFLIKIHSKKIQIPVVEDPADEIDPPRAIELYIESIQGIIVSLINGDSIDDDTALGIFDTALGMLNEPQTIEHTRAAEAAAEAAAARLAERIRDISSRLLTYTTEEVICQLFYGKSIDEIFPPVPPPPPPPARLPLQDEDEDEDEDED